MKNSSYLPLLKILFKDWNLWSPSSVFSKRVIPLLKMEDSNCEGSLWYTWISSNDIHILKSCFFTKEHRNCIKANCRDPRLVACVDVVCVEIGLCIKEFVFIFALKYNVQIFLNFSDLGSYCWWNFNTLPTNIASQETHGEFKKKFFQFILGSYKPSPLNFEIQLKNFKVKTQAL